MRVQPFGEAPVEGGVMGQHDHRGRDERAHCIYVQRMTRHRFGADAGKRGDLGRDRPAGLVVALEGVDHPQHLALRAIGEAHHGQLDHLVAAQVRARGLHVEDQAQPGTGGRGGQGIAHLQLAHYPVVARGLQGGGHGLQLSARRGGRVRQAGSSRSAFAANAR